MSITIDNTNFEEVVKQSDQPVLVDFWAQGCPPCKAISPLIDQIATEVEGQAKVGKLEVNMDTQAIAAEFGIRGVPTLLFFKDGEVKHQINGANFSKEQLVSTLQEL